MLISTKGRYAVRVMLELAENDGNSYLPMKEIAKRQELSLKYLERIMANLTKNNLVEGIAGKGGGCRLTKAPADYKIGEILRATEGDLAPVSCLASDAVTCPRAASCKTLPMWTHFNSMINDYFDGITLQDLLDGNVGEQHPNLSALSGQ